MPHITSLDGFAIRAATFALHSAMISARFSVTNSLNM
jgi:hypothetical protein